MDSDHATDTKKILQDKNLVKSLRYDSQFYKTKLCIFFQSGRCSRKFCKFAHGMEELQRAPDLRKTAMCKNFLATQRCDQEDCTFAHSLDELRATDKFYKTTMCCFYYYGSCKLGELCRHAHSKEELRSLPDVQGLPESLACALLIEQNGRGDSRAVPRTPGPQEAEEQLQEIELLRRTVLEVKQQMGKLRHNEPRMAELQRREHQSLNRLQQLTELQTLQRFAATASAPPRAPVPAGGLTPAAPRDRRYLEQQELQEQMDQLKRQGELQELHHWKLQQQQQMLQQQQLLHSRLPMNAHFPPDLGYPAMPPSFGTGSIDTSLMKMPIMQEALRPPAGPGGLAGPGLSGVGFADASPTRMMEGFPMGQQVGNLNPYSRKVSPPRAPALQAPQTLSNLTNFGPLNSQGVEHNFVSQPQLPGVALDRQRPQFDTFQRPPPPMQQPPPQPLPLAQPLVQPQLPQPQPLQPQLPAQPLQPLQPLAAAGSSQGVAMSDSQKELELLQQQIRYHQHMQKQMQQKVDERMQKLRDMGYNADNLQEEDEEDDDDSLGPIPGWSREGSLRDPHNRKTPMTSPKMLRLEEAGRVDNGSQLDQLDEDEDLGEDPKWVRTRTMPAAVNLKAQAQAQAQQAAAMAGDRPTPSVASTADTAGRSEKEDPAAEDLGPDPTWNRVHSTPAGSASYAAPQPMFQKGVGTSGAADDAFGPNRRATTMDQVRGRAMAPNIQQGVVPVMMLVPQTMMAPQQMNGGLPYLMKQSVPLMQGVQGVVQNVQNVQGHVQPQEDLRQMQAQVLQAAMPEIYED